MSDNTKKVDLVIVMDTSGSMKDEAQALSAAISAAVEQAKSSCPSDLRVDYLGIEGTFEKTKFDETVRNYLTKKAGADAKSLKSRVRGSLKNAGANEDGARAVEDVSELYDWRESAERAIFLLQDESLDGGDMVVTPAAIKANNNAIATALKNEVKVHTYLGTPDAKLAYPSKEDEENMIKEFKRLALRTGGEYYIYITGIADFKQILGDTICASKVPQEERIDDKKDEADDLEDKSADKPSEGGTTDKPKEGTLTCKDLCDQLPEITKAINTLTNFLKNFEEVCKGEKGHSDGCKCQDKKPANEGEKPATTPENPKPADKPVENKPNPEKPVDNKPTQEKPVAEKPATPAYSEIDQIYAITYYDGAYPGNQGDNGDIYIHSGGTGAVVKKAIDNQHGAGWSNAITSDGNHYFGWQGNQIYRQKEGANFEYLRGLSGGKSKDAFAFRKDDTGFFFSAIEGGKIYTFKHPQTNYGTVQVKGAAGNPHQPFSNGTGIIDIAFDGDDRAYLLDSSGRTWRVENTQGTTWEAKYLCQFSSIGAGGEACSYFGLAFDSHGAVYLAGGLRQNGQAKRFLAKSSFASPDKVEKIYEGAWGSASYGNLSSRAFPKFS